MKKFLLGLLAGFVMAGMAAVITFFAAVKLGDRRPSVPSNSALVLKLEGAIPEQSPVDIPIPMFRSQTPMTMVELWSMLRRAESDSRIKALILEPSGVGAGWGQMQEIRDALLRVRKAGKPIYAYLRYPTAREYYLATAADKIYLTSEDVLYLKGLRAEVEFYRETLAKIGVKMEVETAGKYKDAADQYSRDSLTPESREVINSLLDTLYAHITGVIAEGRKMPVQRVKSLIDEGPFLATKAAASGLVDGLKYEDEFYDGIKKDLKLETMDKVSHRQYYQSLSPRSGGAKVAFVVGEGPILRGSRGAEAFGDAVDIRSATFSRMLRDVAEDATIRGVVLRVNSPGGDAIASDEILREVRNLSKKKPLVVSMADVAASGGYYISMSGDPVLAYPNTYTGSIGVVFSKPDLGGLYEKLGISVETITRGKNADLDSMHKPMSPAARAKLREGIDQTYQTFLARVAEGRKKDKAVIEPLAQGRVWLGSQARANGLVDELGGLDRAFDMLREKAKLGKDERLAIVPYPRRRNILEQFLGGEDGFERAAARMRFARWARESGLNMVLRDSWSAALANPELWTTGAPLTVIPFVLRIQ
ncbi:MAG: signal peptide peptidase SppA [Bryobacteraceae bacterium]